MFTRLLLKLAGPVPSLKKEMRCSCKTFAEYCQVSAKDTRYRHATVYNTEKDFSTIKNPTSHTNTEAML